MKVHGPLSLLVMSVLVGCTGTEVVIESSGAVGALAAAAATPNTLTWEWDPTALGVEAHGYLLLVGTDSATLAAGGDGVLAWDSQDDPNLGFADAPQGAGVVHRTTVNGLTPDTKYYAELWALADAAARNPLARGSGSTAPRLTSSLTIFAESLPPGATTDFFTVDATHPHGGQDDLRVFNAGAWASARIYLDLDLSATTASDWRDSYFELFMYVDPCLNRPEPIAYLTVGLTPTAGATTFQLEVAHYAVFPNRTEWQQLQIPLRELVKGAAAGAEAMTPATFGSRLGTVLVGFETPADCAVYFDDLALWY